MVCKNCKNKIEEGKNVCATCGARVMPKKTKKMNLANKLTMLRIILVPIFVLCLIEEFQTVTWLKYVGLVVFILASVTDFLDGYISRKTGTVTDFGKIMDPLADKLLVSAGFIMLTGLHVIPAYITMIIIFRDFWVSSIRIFGMNNKTAIAAVLSGKLKTLFQLCGLTLGILGLSLGKEVAFAEFLTTGAYGMKGIVLLNNVFMTIFITGAVITTIWSMVDYTVKFKKHISLDK